MHRAVVLAFLVLAALPKWAVAESLVAYRIVDEAIAEPLTAELGDPVRGRRIVRDTSNVTCLICHAMPIPEDPDHGTIGPPLAGVGDRYSAAELRLRLVDPKILNPETVMPSYYRVDSLFRVPEAYRDRTIYSAQEIEDVIAYLTTLRDRDQQTSVATTARAVVGQPGRDDQRYDVEGRKSGYLYMGESTRALQDDDFQNPGFFAVERGRQIWDTVEGTEGLSCASCHEDAAATMRGVATRYPVYDSDRGGLVDLDLQINDMRTRLMGAAPYPYESEDLLALGAFVAFQSRGMPIDVQIDGPARPHFKAGRAFYFRRRGQLDLSCSQCHDDRSGMRLRGDVISQGQVNGFPLYRLLWRQVASRLRMFEWCNQSIRAEPFPLDSAEYRDLELYVAWRGRGLPIEAPAIRR